MESAEPLSDDELATWLKATLAASHPLPGCADAFLADVSADRLVDLMRIEGLSVVWDDPDV